MTKGQIISDMPTAHNRSDAIGDYVGNVDEMRIKIAAMQLETDLLVMQARRFINEIPCPIVRMVLSDKYINNLYYWDIIEGIGCEDIVTERDVLGIMELVFWDVEMAM